MTELPRIQFLHVGPLGDCPFPCGTQFLHVDPVDQRRLPEFYARADVFVLPSREEGLALVMAQALGCGLPVVCTPRTGGGDLRRWIDRPEAIIEVPEDDEAALEAGLLAGLELSSRVRGADLLGGRGRMSLTWQAYGRRYHDRLVELSCASEDSGKTPVLLR